MSRWIRGIYNAAANFNMSRSLRAAAGRTLDRNDKQLHTSADQRNQHVESSQSGESSKLGNSTDGTASTTANRSTVIVGNDVIITDSRDICDTQCNKCHPVFCDHIEREYNDYLDATRSTQGQDSGSRLRTGNEFGDSQRSSHATRTNVEYLTGIPTGTTI